MGLNVFLWEIPYFPNFEILTTEMASEPLTEKNSGQSYSDWWNLFIGQRRSTLNESITSLLRLCFTYDVKLEEVIKNSLNCNR
jgi:hypothetical protein